MKVKVSKTQYAILEAFLAIRDEDLLVKIDSEEKRDWTVVRKVTNREKTIKALKVLNSNYVNGDLLAPHDVLKTYDTLVS